MAAITPVLLKGAEGASLLLKIPISSSDTVASLKKKAAQAAGVPISRVQQVEFLGQTLSETDQVDKVGISSTGADYRTADQHIYPNAWWSSPYCKAYIKVRDPTWPAGRLADFVISVRWVLGLLLLLFVSAMAS